MVSIFNFNKIQTTKLYFFYILLNLYFKLAKFSMPSPFKSFTSLNKEIENTSSFLNEMNETLSTNLPSNLNKALANSSKNDTTPIPNEYTFIELYVFPVIVIIGTVCNFLTFLVMRRKKMQHQSTYFYMAVLAVADELVLLVGCLNTSLYAYFNTNFLFLSEISCKLACLALYATFHFSVWVVVIMTIERFVAVAFPLQASRICTVKRAKIATMLLALLILCINAHFLFTHSLQRNSETESDQCYATTDAYRNFMISIWTWIDGVLYSFIPLSLLIIFNILIVHNLVKAKNTIKKYNDNHKSSSKKILERSSTSKELDLNHSNKKGSEKNLRHFHLTLSNSCCNFFSKQLNSNQSSTLNYKNYLFKPATSTNLRNDNTDDKNNINVNNKSTISNYHQQSNLHSENFKYNSTGHRFSQQSQQSSQSQSQQSSYANRKLTIMLLMVSITFCLTSTPIVILQYLQLAGFFTESYEIYVIKGIFLSLQYLNHSVNFFLYAVTGKSFRREFYDMFSECVNKKSKFHKATNMTKATANQTIRTNNRAIKIDSFSNTSQNNQFNKAVPLIKITEANSNENVNELLNADISQKKGKEEDSHEINNQVSDTNYSWDILINSSSSISYELVLNKVDQDSDDNRITIV